MIDNRFFIDSFLNNLPFYGLILIGIGIIFFIGNKRKKGNYGTAKKATLRLVKKMGLLVDEGILLGKFKGKYLRLKPALSVLCLAPPGTGKTVSLAIPNICVLNRSLVVNDAKGELYQKTHRHRRKFSKVYNLDFMAEHPTTFYNPLQVNEEDKVNQFIKQVSRIAHILYPVKGGENDHWQINAQKLFKFFALVAYYEYQKIKSLFLSF